VREGRLLALCKLTDPVMDPDPAHCSFTHILSHTK
jgi:hypothetical protein